MKNFARAGGEEKSVIERHADAAGWRMPLLTRINRLPRTFGFAATFVAISWLVLDQGWSSWNLFFAGVFFLVYPQLLYWFEYWRRARSSIEYRAMMFDAFLLGYWTAHIEFSALMAFTFLTTVVLNNTMTGGVRQTARALLWYGLGILVVVLSTGFNWSPAAPLPLNGFILLSLLMYVFSVALAFNMQNQRLLRTKRSLTHSNQVFQTMINLTELTDDSENLHDMVHSALTELQRLWPDCSFGMILKDPALRDDVHFAVFTDDLDTHQQSRIREQVAALKNDFPETDAIKNGSGQTYWLLYPLTERLGRFRGILAIQGLTKPDDHDSTLPLLVSQLGTAISNKLLTMELQVSAERDALTGVYNRGQLDKALASAQVRQKQNQTDHFSVLLVDLVGLKGINDQYGHALGDTLIREAAAAMQEICRDSDTLFRFGGDEFVILCKDDSGQGAKALEKRIQTRVQGRPISLETTDGEAITTTLQLSVGFASSDQVPATTVLQQADKRMYEQKQKWYNQEGERRC